MCVCAQVCVCVYACVRACVCASVYTRVRCEYYEGEREFGLRAPRAGSRGLETSGRKVGRGVSCARCADAGLCIDGEAHPEKRLLEKDMQGAIKNCCACGGGKGKCSDLQYVSFLFLKAQRPQVCCLLRLLPCVLLHSATPRSPDSRLEEEEEEETLA